MRYGLLQKQGLRAREIQKPTLQKTVVDFPTLDTVHSQWRYF